MEDTNKKPEYVTRELFKDSGSYKDDVFIAVNGKSVVVKRGEKVKLEKKYAEALDNSIVQDKATAKLMEEKAEEFANESRNRGL